MRTFITLCRGLALFALSAGTAWAALPEGVSVQIVETDPPATATLGAREPLYLRIRYDSTVALRFQAVGVVDSSGVLAGAAMNPAPRYAPGTSEAIVWVSYDKATQIDEVRVTIFDAQWKPLHTLSQPVTVSWSGEKPRVWRTPAPWAKQLNQTQQEMHYHDIDASRESGSDWAGILVVLAGWSVVGYLLLQTYMGMRYRGRWRKAALQPLWVTVPLIAYTAFALAKGSNLWPLMLIFLTPFAFIYLVGVWAVKQIRGRGDEGTPG